MDEYKSLEKYRKKNQKRDKEEDEKSKFLRRLVSKILLCCILFMFFLIGTKTNQKFQSIIYEEVYAKSLSFAPFRAWYENSFGEVFPLEHLFPQDVMVFEETLQYEEANLYKDGVALKVSNHYLIPFLDSGVVIYKGSKEDYGDTIIVQQENGVEVWYSNIYYGDVDLYDYVQKGDLVGEAEENTFYLVFQKDGKFLDYKDFI